MPRGSGGRSGSRYALPRAARSPPRPQTVNHAPPPAPVPASGGGSLLDRLGFSIVDGMAVATGSAATDRAIDWIMGRPTVQYEMVNSEAARPAPAASSVADACGIHSKAFQDCLNNYGTEISKCQFYHDMLSECKRNSGAMSA